MCRVGDSIQTESYESKLTCTNESEKTLMMIHSFGERAMLVDALMRY